MVNPEMLQSTEAMQTPLNGQTYQTDGLIVREHQTFSKAVVRADFDNGDVVTALNASAGLSPVLDANTFSGNATHSLFWMGPDERLVYSKSQDSTKLVNALREGLPSGKSAVVDVSDYYTVLQVSGDNARQVLSSGTPFDVHPRVFKPGQCAQTRFGNATVLLSCQEESAGYDLQVRWTFAEYLWGYLCRVGGFL